LSVNVFIGGGVGAGYTKPKAPQPTGKGKAARATANRFFFDGRMRARVSFFFLLLFVFFTSFVLRGRKGIGEEASSAGYDQAGPGMYIYSMAARRPEQ
jgi:hypothetical protein